MTGSDHDANSLTIELAGAQRCEKTDTVDNRVKQLAVRGKVRCRKYFGKEEGWIPTYAFMRNYNCHQYTSSISCKLSRRRKEFYTHTSRSILELSHLFSRGIALGRASLDGFDVHGNKFCNCEIRVCWQSWDERDGLLKLRR